MKLIFLDIDGVLNSHEKLPSGYNGIGHGQMLLFNRILDEVPESHIVVSSAWRYQFHLGYMQHAGFATMLQLHGIKCRDRLHGFTDLDPVECEPCHFDTETWFQLGLRWRPRQILDYVKNHTPDGYVVLDDLPLDVPNFVKTDGTVGLTNGDAERAIAILKEPNHA